MRLSKPIDRADPVRTLRRWFDELSQDWTGAASLQHALIDAILTLRHTWEKDGWCNWGEDYVELVDLLARHLTTGQAGQRTLRDLSMVKLAGPDEELSATDELDRLTKDVMIWCEQHPVWIQLPEGFHFWDDAPPVSTVPPTVTEPASSLRDEIRAWAFTKGAKEPEQDWDLQLANLREYDLYVELAADADCPNADYFLRLLYLIVGDAVRTSYRSESAEIVQQLLGRSREYADLRMDRWRARSLELMRSPDAFVYEDWCAGQYVMRDLKSS